MLFGQPELGVNFVEDATATTDARGCYKADLGKYPWSTGAVRALVLAPGFKVGDRKVEAGVRAATADFELEAQPWKETQVRLEDQSGKPVAGVEIICSVHRVTWAKVTTDAEGRCRVAMAHDVGMALSARPKGARALMLSLAGTEDEQASITLPVLPPIGGHVLDPQGLPASDVTIGRWLTFQADGGREMLPFSAVLSTSPTTMGAL